MFSSDYIYNLYKELYYTEHEIKDRISNRINFVISLFIVINGAIVYCIKEFIQIIDYIQPWLVFLIPTIWGIGYLVSLFLLFKTYFGYGYDYIPSPQEFEKNKNKYLTYYHANKSYFDEKNISQNTVIDSCIKENLIEIYCSCTTHNGIENSRKSSYLRLLSWSIVAILFVTIIVFILTAILNKPVYYDNYKYIINVLRR